MKLWVQMSTPSLLVSTPTQAENEVRGLSAGSQKLAKWTKIELWVSHLIKAMQQKNNNGS